METKPASRYPLELDIEFKKSYARDLSSGTLKNVSMTGAFIENSLDDLNFRDKITINLNLSGRERVLAATVIWKNQRGCGIRFSPFNNQDIQIVDDLIYFLESKRETRKDVLTNIFKKVS
jgi:ABC-type uncharacterized transport system ATPase subunit